MKAKGISERAILEKTAEKPERSREIRENVADKPAETASHPGRDSGGISLRRVKRLPPRPFRRLRRWYPAPCRPCGRPKPPRLKPRAHPEERRDANDLARAAIDRLRGSNDGSPRPQEAARTPDAARIPEAARIPDAPRVVLAPAVRPLPPPVMVSTPARETVDSTTGSLETRPPYAAAARNDDPAPPDAAGRHPVTPRSICGPRRRDRCRRLGAASRARNTAEDVLSAAKSVFHAVLPK